MKSLCATYSAILIVIQLLVSFLNCSMGADWSITCNSNSSGIMCCDNDPKDNICCKEKSCRDPKFTANAAYFVELLRTI
uniref:Hypotheticial protein n=1 Tax=Schistosoma japonicum TaxID=6182 RepID=C7TYH6_SCHJA|nr:hypotheticial protein [Schistosoma japonicum]